MYKCFSYYSSLYRIKWKWVETVTLKDCDTHSDFDLATSDYQLELLVGVQGTNSDLSLANSD